MRRLLVVVLLVLLPLRGWAANAMALAVLPTNPGSVAHALCPDHAPTVADAAHDGGHDGTGNDTAAHEASQTHPHCTACQLPALNWPVWPTLVAALPQGTPVAHAAVLRNPAPRQLIKPPIA